MGEFFVFSGVLTYSISYNANNVKHGATILIPKTIVDINNEMIIAYDLNQTPNLYSVFNTIKSGLKNIFKLEGERLVKRL